MPRDEAEHLTRVLRLGVGDTVAVFDGRGHEFLARVVERARAATSRVADCCRASSPPPEPAVALTLAQAVLKGDKMDDVVRDAVMLGAAAIQPIVTQAHRDDGGGADARARASIAGGASRWRRSSSRAAPSLPEIRMPLTFEDYLDEPPAGAAADAGRAVGVRGRRTDSALAAASRRRPMPRCSSDPKAAGRRRSARRRARTACG